MDERKQRLTREQIERVRRLLSKGKTDEEICAAMGINTPSTLRTYLWECGYGIETVTSIRQLRELQREPVP